MSKEVAVQTRSNRIANQLQRQAQRGNPLAVAAQAYPVAAKLVTDLASGVIENYVSSSQKLTNSNMRNTKGGNTQEKQKKQSQPSQRRAKRGSAQGNQNRGGGTQFNLMPRIRGQVRDQLATTFTDYYDLSCDSSGTVVSAINLALTNPTGDTNAPLANVVPRLATVGQAYRMFQISSVRFSFLSLVPSTQGGFLSLAVDPLPAAGAPTTQSQVTRHAGNNMGDIKDDYTVVFVPSRIGKTGLKYVNPTSGITNSADEVCYGTFQVYGKAIGLSAVTLIGKIKIDIAIKFSGAT